MTSSTQVSFRYIGIPVDEGEISGLCLWYPTRELAESFFKHLNSYLSISNKAQRDPLEILAEEEATGSYLLAISFGFEDITRRVEISGVAKRYINQIQSSLVKFPRYLVAAGYDTRLGPKLLELSTNHVFVNYITINKIKYLGRTTSTFNAWEQIVHTQNIQFA